MRERAAAAAAIAAVASAVTGCGGHAHAGTVDWGRPGPAKLSTATLVAAEGAGAHRLALWTARNAAHELCVGWRLGGNARPARFHCQRRGLERPVLWVQGGGGAGENVDWGGDVGLVAPGVSRVVADGHGVRLRPAAGLHRWRAFAEGGGGQPASELDAYGDARQLLEDDGLWINPDGEGCDCTTTPHGWSGTYAYVPEQQRGDDARAIALTLAVPGVRDILKDRRAWIDLGMGWQKCAGGTIGRGEEIKLWRPASFHATLPFEHPAPAHTHVAYVWGVHHVYAIHSSELLAWVDTSSWRVVGVETAFESGMEIPLGVVEQPKPGGGYDDPTACPQGD